MAESVSGHDVSVIIPMYNAEKTIRRCVENAAGQGVLEILLVDDGSEDGTQREAERLAERYPGVRLLASPHGGVSAARNRGLREARGEWVLFLDADDRLAEGAVRCLLSQAGEGMDACLGGIVRGNARPGAVDGRKRTEMDRDELINYALAEATDRLTVHGWIFRKAVCRGVFFREDLRLGEDSEWVLRVLSSCRGAAVTGTPVYLYTISDGSAVHGWKEGRTAEYLKTLRAVAETGTASEKNWPLFVLSTLLLILTHDTFHPRNPAGRKEKLRQAERLRETPVFAEALRKADLSCLGRAKRLVLEWIRADRLRPVYCAVRLRQAWNAARAEK